jgi:hypothetical protein
LIKRRCKLRRFVKVFRKLGVFDKDLASRVELEVAASRAAT